MWQEVLCAELSVGSHKQYFSLKQLADELINVLPLSAEAFKSLLASQFDARKNIDFNDLHNMINYISSALGEEKLSQYLTDDSGSSQNIESTGTWYLSDSTCDLCKQDSLFLDVYVNRHKVGDLSETPLPQKELSLKSLVDGRGVYTTHYSYKHYTLIISTVREQKKLKIDVIRS
ncbi:hypothetical protein F4826_004751 [Rahnella inusitata]|nr:hypothetical protein [Rahnella inusitata]